MRICFLFPYPLGESPSQRFRFEQYLGALTLTGSTVKTQPFWDLETWKILYAPGHRIQKIKGFLIGLLHRLKILLVIHKFDYVFVHRECVPLGPPFFEWVISKILRKRIIYDFDDAIWLPNTSTENKFAAIAKYHGKVKSICRWGYKISCGNQYLADYAKAFNRNVIINPTTVDTETLHNPDMHPSLQDCDHITIGWTGSHSTLPYLNSLVPVLSLLSAKYPQVRLLVISDRPPDFHLDCLKFLPWTKETEVNDLMEIDFGLMPLPNDTWAQGKCGFKALQYMSLGKPALASPVGVNTSIIDHGTNGFLCSTDQEWISAMEFLIQHREECVKMGMHGRNKIVHRYSVFSNTPNFLSLFST